MLRSGRRIGDVVLCESRSGRDVPVKHDKSLERVEEAQLCAGHFWTARYFRIPGS
jgi:hypothetical protein